MGRYQPIGEFLAAQGRARLRLSFAELEGVLGRALPPSAFRHAAWWANNPAGHSHCRAWVSAGWRTEDVDLAGRAVTFARMASATPVPSLQAGLFGALKGAIRIRGDIAVPSGEAWDAESGTLCHE